MRLINLFIFILFNFTFQTFFFRYFTGWSKQDIETNGKRRFRKCWWKSQKVCILVKLSGSFCTHRNGYYLIHEKLPVRTKPSVQLESLHILNYLSFCFMTIIRLALDKSYVYVRSLYISYLFRIEWLNISFWNLTWIIFETVIIFI